MVTSVKLVGAVICYTISIVLGGVGFIFSYLGSSFTDLGDLLQFGKPTKDPDES